MRNFENLNIDIESIYALLIKARTIGNKNRGKDRAVLLRSFLNKVTEATLNWSESQCDRCFECLLRHYIEPDKLKLLLSTSGFGEPYVHLNPASRRREAYREAHTVNNYAEDPKTLEKRENQALRSMAEQIVSDYRNDRTTLLHTILEGFGYQEIQALGLETLVESVTNAHKEVDSDPYGLARSGKIANISSPGDLFVGRIAALKALQSGFEEGYHTQLISGVSGHGKSRSALEYARTHKNDYQIICWVNASSESCILSSVVKFLRVAGVKLESFAPEYIRDVFLEFFRVNTKWLIIYDNPNLAIAKQKEILTSYMPPEPRGHILVTSEVGIDFDGWKCHLLERLMKGENTTLFLEKALARENPYDEMDKVALLCRGDIHALTLAASYINHSTWADCNTYLNLMADYGFSSDEQLPEQPYRDHVFAAFELLLNASYVKMLYHNDAVDEAAQRILEAGAMLGHCDMDLNFLCSAFPVLSKQVKAVYADEESQKRLVARLKDFGFYEVSDGILHYNNRLNILETGVVGIDRMRYFCSQLLENMNDTIISIKNNRYLTAASEEILLHAAAYADEIVTFANHYNVLDGGNTMEERYPEVWRLSYYSKSWMPI